MSEPMRKRKQAPESYTPKMPAIVSMMQEHAGQADIKEEPLQKGASEMFTTERLIIRHFQAEDWKDVLELANSQKTYAFADCDEAWPTGEDEIKGATSWFASNENIWAFELKSENKVICFVNFNSFLDGILYLGHVMNIYYFGQELEEEGLRTLFTYAFNEMGANIIRCTWTYADKEKLIPLYNLHMKVTERFMANKFTPGSTEQFEACRLEVSKEDFSTPMKS